ncbi:phosphotyrosine protein phosphatase [bacterium]|nr:phosphotyrosine protein phosphatase [bacterium]
MKHVLFVCGRNKRRSPTAEAIFAGFPDIEVDSAGLSEDSVSPLDTDLIAWADIIFVMERSHLGRLKSRYSRQLKASRVVCLNIPDKYEYMDDRLIALLRAKVTPMIS